MKFKRVLLSTALMSLFCAATYAQTEVTELLQSGKNENYLNNVVKCNEQTADCKVKFFTNFESGSLDSVSLKSMAYVA